MPFSRIYAPFDRWRQLTPAERRFAVEAWLAAPWLCAALEWAGLPRTLDGIDRLAGAVPRKLWGEDAGLPLEAGGRLAALAFRAHPMLRSTCLRRAVVQLALRRLRNQGARLVLGVRRTDAADGRAPVQAHAWIEDSDEATSQHEFTPLFQKELTP